MKEEKIILEGARRKQLSGMVWLPDDEPRAILQVTHGMTEHMGRYEKLAEELTQHGIIVAGFDLRGHGKNNVDAEYASLGEGGWRESVKEMHFFFKMLDERYPDLPHYMLGFSMGSFLLREYLNKYRDNVAGAVLMGTGHQSWITLVLIRLLVKLQIKRSGFNETTPLVQKLSFGVYNKKFEPTKTDFDWLCADMKQLTDYLLDPYCKDAISSGLFWQLLGSMQRVGKKNAYVRWRKNMPILLLSGEEDAVGNFGKGVLSVKKAMKKAGLTSVRMHMFPNARYDLLHEEQSGTTEKVYKLLLKWILEG